MFRRTVSARDVTASALAAALAATIFFVHWHMDLGAVSGVLYILVIWIASTAERNSAMWIAAVVCSLLVVIGDTISPGSEAEWKIYSNHVVSVLVIWMAAFLLKERKLAAPNRILLASIIDSTDDAVIGKTLEGVVTSWNRGAEKLYGYSAEEMIGQPISRLVPADRPDEVPEILRKLKKGEPVGNFETVRVRKDGSLRYVSLTISPIKNQYGEYVGASTIARDITPRRQMEEMQRYLNAQLAKVNEALRESNSDLEQFAYVASHDLQAPLRQIGGFVQLLEKAYGDQLDEKARRWIEYSVAGVERMQTLINNLLDYSRVGSHTRPFESVDLNEAVTEAARLLDASIKESGAELIYDELPVVRADPLQMVQLLQNLINNSIKYRGDQPPQIQIRSTMNGGEWVISVRDNGIGIDPDYDEAVFMLLKRLHTEDAYPGTGIGLAVCRRIVQRHGGRIWVESEPGTGATFFFTLPERSVET